MYRVITSWLTTLFFRTFNKGSLAILKVEGDENKNLFGQQDDRIYQGEGGVIQSIPNGNEKQNKKP